MEKGEQIILSIKPIWARLIMSGHKTVELRRRFSMLLKSPVIAFLYSTGPEKAMIGSAYIESIVILPPDELWPRVSKKACVTEDQYRAYFDGATEAAALFLGGIKALPNSVPLSILRSAADFSPPCHGGVRSLRNSNY